MQVKTLRSTSVVHNTAPSATRQQMETAVEDAENAKIERYQQQCQEASMLFEPLGTDLYGGLGPPGLPNPCTPP